MGILIKPSSAVTTIRGPGDPAPLAQTARTLLRAKIGWSEERDPSTGRGLNVGPICTWSREGIHLHEGQPWCGAFACQGPRRALLLLDDPRLAEWEAIATADVDLLHQRLLERGLVTTHTPGLPPPPDAFFVFWAKLGDGGRPIMHTDGRPNLRHVGVVDDRPCGEHAFTTLEGNSGDSACAHVYGYAAPGLWAYARLPWERS